MNAKGALAVMNRAKDNVQARLDGRRIYPLGSHCRTIETRRLRALRLVVYDATDRWMELVDAEMWANAAREVER